MIIKYNVVIPWFQANKIKEVDWGDDLMFKHEWQNKNVCLTSMSYDVLLKYIENSKMMMCYAIDTKYE